MTIPLSVTIGFCALLLGVFLSVLFRLFGSKDAAIGTLTTFIVLSFLTGVISQIVISCEKSSVEEQAKIAVTLEELGPEWRAVYNMSENEDLSNSSKELVFGSMVEQIDKTITLSVAQYDFIYNSVKAIVCSKSCCDECLEWQNKVEGKLTPYIDVEQFWESESQ